MTDLGQPWPMLITRGAVVALGGAIADFGFRSWRRTRTSSTPLPRAGFGPLSAVAAGVRLGVCTASDDPFTASIARSALMVGGFRVIFAGPRSRMG
jgi:hypothetical protein